MKPVICSKCNGEIREWSEFCPECGEEIENFARPAGFWIRFGAHIIDDLIIIPIGILAFWNILSLKSMSLMFVLGGVGLVYKPFMEAFCGATVGKMLCGIKVVNDKSEKLSLMSAYIRFLPFLGSTVVSLLGQYFLFSSEDFATITTLLEYSQTQQSNGPDFVGLALGVIVIVDCLFAAFTFRKRALHDMMADSYCVYRAI